MWRLLSHPALLAAPLALALLLTAAHLALPQAPTSIAADPLASNAWLATTAETTTLGGVMRPLGLFELAENPIWRALLALAAAVLLVRLSNRLWMAFRTRKLQPPQEILPTLECCDLTLEALSADEWQNVCAAQCSRNAAIIPEEKEAAVLWLGDRNQPFTWLIGLLELGALLVALALLLNLRAGWQIVDIELTPGDKASLQPYSEDTLSLDEAAEMLSLCCQIRRDFSLGSGGVNTGSVRVREGSVGSALIVRVSEDGRDLPLQAIEQSGDLAPAVVVRFPQERSERTVAVPEANLFLRIVNTGPQMYQIQALDAANTVLISENITDDATLKTGSLTLHLQPTRFVTLDVMARPYLWLLIPALILALAGLLARWRRPYFRLGVRYDPGGAALRWQGHQGARPTLTEFADLLADHAGDD